MLFRSLIALKIAEEIENKMRVAWGNINLGEVSIQLNKLDDAKKYLDKGLSLAQATGNKAFIQDAYSSLASLDSLQGNYQSAYENYKMFILYRDSVSGKETNEKLVRQQMQFDFDKKEVSTKQEQEQKLAAEKLRFEQLRADDQIKQARISFETQLQFEKETAAERSLQDQLMAETKLGFEQDKAAQTILQQKAIATANLQKEKAVADERIKQERARAAEEKRNNRIKITAAFLIVSLLFITVLVRQRKRA